MADETTKTSEELVQAIANQDLNEFLYIVDEASKLQDSRIQNFIRDFVAKDHQQHLVQAGYEPTCPKCGAKHAHKDGKRGQIQRYRCDECGHRFTPFSGSLLEKSNYTWAVWVEVIRGMLAGLSLESTQRILAEDYKCVRISKDTVWLMRMKVMAAIQALPSPTLAGVVQFDDTFLREDQKASHTLENPLPGDILEEREPRYGRQPSQLGIRGSEFATVTTAIDQSGHCVCRLTAMGVVPVEVMYDFINDHTEAISYACSDADDTYRNVFRDMGVPHYIHPSTYLKTVEAAGYVQPSRKDKVLAKQQKEANDAILERLWDAGLIDRIENRGAMTWRQFKSLKRDNKLSLGRVNSLHNSLKENLEKRTRGVSTKLLPLYLAWFEYVHNRTVDAGHKLVSTKDAEAILLDAISARRNITTAELDEIRVNPLPLPTPSGRYLHMLFRITDDVRSKSGNGGFYFGDEDGIETFDRREIMWNMTDGQLRTLAKAAHIKSYVNKTRTTLINELMSKEGLDDIFFLVVANNAVERLPETDATNEEPQPYRRVPDRRDYKGLFTLNRMPLPSRAKGPVVFLDCETTGFSPDDNEILSLAIVSQDGEVLYDSLIKPKHRKSWSKSEAVHHISPKDVENAPTLEDEKEKIESILFSAGCIVGWQVCFDLRFLYAGGIDIPTDPKTRCDLMRGYCHWRSRKDEGYSKSKEKLEEAAAYFGLLHNPHNALGDTAVLLDIWTRVGGKIR